MDEFDLTTSQVIAQVLCRARVTNLTQPGDVALWTHVMACWLGSTRQLRDTLKYYSSVRPREQPLLLGFDHNQNYNANQYPTPKHSYQHKSEANKYLVMVSSEISKR